MSDVNRFVDSYHNGKVVRTYVDPPESSEEGWHVQAPGCKHCRHGWHFTSCDNCTCSTSCNDTVMSQSEEHLIRGEE